MENSGNPERGRDATLAPVEQLHWVRHGDEYETAVLSGDPERPGDSYVMRYRVLVACDVPPHSHPEDEHATVIAGEISVGLGRKFLADALRPLTAGSYALIPRNLPHFTRYAAGTIVQVHGIGPLVVNYLAQ
jgi:quercetin dioxygenase-like cupin family protein